MKRRRALARWCALTGALVAAVAGRSAAAVESNPVPVPTVAAELQFDGTRYIVDFGPSTGTAAADAVLTTAGVEAGAVVQRIEEIGQYVVVVDEATAARLDADPATVAVVADSVVTLLYTPNDPQTPTMQNLDDIGAEGAWNTYPGPAGFDADGPFTGAPIGIVDSGVDSRHQEFAGPTGSLFAAKVPHCVRYAANILFDPVVCGNGASDTISHGTHVAGTAAAIGGDGRGIPGISPTSPVYSYKACQSQFCWLGDVSAGIVDATDDGAKVINLSLGGIVPVGPWQEAVLYALRHDVVVVAAAGNNGTSAYSYPASFNGVLSVGALTTGTTQRASFSQFNDEVDIAAPGTSILSSVAPEAAGGADDAYASYSGTSMATPHVAGAAALIRSAHPDWSAGRVRGALLATATDIGAPGVDPETGRGRLNVDAAIDYVPVADGDLDDDGFADAIDGDRYDPSRWDVVPTNVSSTVSGTTVSVGSFFGLTFVTITAPDRLLFAFVNLAGSGTSLDQVTLQGVGWQWGPGFFQTPDFTVTLNSAINRMTVSVGGTVPLSVAGTATGTMQFSIS